MKKTFAMLAVLLAVSANSALAQVSVAPVADNPTPQLNETVCIQVDVAGVTDLYAASFDFAYNPAVLDYTGATEGTFLNQDGGNTHMRESALNNDENSGRIVVGVTREAAAIGVSGSGTVATLCFQAVGAYCGTSDISFENADLEGPAQDSIISATWNGTTVTISLASPTNPATSDPGIHDQINLCWDTVSGAEEYEIYRADTPGGAYELLTTTAATCYNDAACVLSTLNYYYQVKALASGGACISEFSPEVAGLAAGLLGDINLDNRVNGRDLSRLARAYNSILGGPRFNCRTDLNRDNTVDGEDLILLAADFGRTLP